MNAVAHDEPPEVHLDFPFEGVEECRVQLYPEHIYLCKLSITPRYQGRGLGSRVLRELKRRGLRIELCPYPDDPDKYAELIRFYQRNGFELTDGIDLMVWNP